MPTQNFYTQIVTQLGISKQLAIVRFAMAGYCIDYNIPNFNQIVQQLKLD